MRSGGVARCTGRACPRARVSAQPRAQRRSLGRLRLGVVRVELLRLAPRVPVPHLRGARAWAVSGARKRAPLGLRDAPRRAALLRASGAGRRCGAAASRAPVRAGGTWPAARSHAAHKGRKRMRTRLEHRAASQAQHGGVGDLLGHADAARRDLGRALGVRRAHHCHGGGRGERWRGGAVFWSLGASRRARACAGCDDTRPLRCAYTGAAGRCVAWRYRHRHIVRRSAAWLRRDMRHSPAPACRPAPAGRPRTSCPPPRG